MFAQEGMHFAFCTKKKVPRLSERPMIGYFDVSCIISQQVHRSRWASMGSGTSGSGRCWRGRQLSAGIGAEAVAADSRPYARSDR